MKDTRSTVISILDLFDDFLLDRHIIIENRERDDDPEAKIDPVAIYGSDYRNHGLKAPAFKRGDERPYVYS